MITGDIRATYVEKAAVAMPQSEPNEALCLVGQLTEQLQEFEKLYRNVPESMASGAIEHFRGLIAIFDERHNRLSGLALAEINRIQIELIENSSAGRSLRQRLECYLDQSNHTHAKSLTALINDVLCGSDVGLADFMKAGFDSDEQLLYLITAFLVCQRKEAELTDRLAVLERDVYESKDARLQARLLLAKSLENLGYIRDAHSLVDEWQKLFSVGQVLPSGAERVIGVKSRTEVILDRQSNFQAMLAELKTFREKFGHCDVPRRYKENQRLAVWVANLRSRRKKGLLSRERVEELDRLGFLWESNRRLWQNYFDALAQFIKEHGHSFVPIDYEENPSLAKWVRNLRKDVRRQSVSERRIAALRAIGFDFEVREKVWYERFDQLRLFKERFGHCLVPNAWPENRTLSRWVSHQRQCYKNGQIEAERVALLDSLGFVWTPPRGRPIK